MFLINVAVLLAIRSYIAVRGATSSSFRRGRFSWNFIRWRNHAYSTVVQLFHEISFDDVIMLTQPWYEHRDG